MSSFRHILVPTDFGPAANAALQQALDLATLLGSELTVLHSYEPPMYAYSEMMYLSGPALEAIEMAARKQLDASMLEARKRVLGAHEVLHCGSAVDDVLSVIETRKIDLVVMGTHGHRGIRHALLGSVAEKVVRLSPVPVLTVHAPAAAQANKAA